jgi:hypothetical protein
MPDYFTHKHTTGTYLPKHGQHIDSISLRGAGYRIGFIQLPAKMIKLKSTQLENCKLQLDKLVLQLQQGEGNQGVLGAAATPPLKQLRLADCLLLDGEEGLASALVLLPGLEHLSISNSYNTLGQLKVPLSDMLPGLQELTYLELGNVSMQGWFGDPANLQRLSGLNRLADLRLLGLQTGDHITASTLSGAQSLTHLQLQGIRQVGTYFDPAALQGKTLLQHLELQSCRTQEGQWLSQLQHLQQLTCLILALTWYNIDPYPSASDYSALTASSKLQHLDLTIHMSTAVWQHIFPVSRQLPHLRSLRLTTLLPTRNASLCMQVISSGTRGTDCLPCHSEGCGPSKQSRYYIYAVIAG